MLVAADTETDLIRPALLAPPLTCVSFAWKGANGLEALLKDHVEGAQRLRHHLERKDEFVGANIPYDFAVVAEEEPSLLPLIFDAYDDGRVQDVQLIQKIIDNAKGELGGYWPGGGQRKVDYRYNLAELVMRHLKIDLSAEKNDPAAWRLRYGELRGVPISEYPKEASAYALNDAIYTYQVREKQEPEMGLVRDLALQARAQFALHLCSCWGVRTDPQAIRRLEEGARKEYDELTEALVKEGLVRPARTLKNGRVEESSKDTKVAKARMVQVMASLGEEVKLTEKGEELAAERELTSDEVLKYASLDEDACIQSGDEILLKYAERTSISTVVTSNIPALWKGVDLPLQPEYEVFLETGRTSCRESKDDKGKKKSILNGYQVQNVRRLPGIRECFAARPGYVFYDVDFGQLELKTVGQALLKIVGWSKLAEALNAGLDVHLALAAQIVGCSYEEAKVRRKNKDKAVSDARQIAKGANFGLPGGMGARGFQIYARTQPERIILTIEQCKEIKDNWLSAWPEFREYFEWAKGMTDEGGALQEQLFSGRLRGRVPYGAFCNGMFQGLGADVAKSAHAVVTKKCYVETECSVCGGNGASCDRCGGTGVSPLFGSRPWGFMHDQIIGEAFEEIGHEVAFECRDVMVKAANEWLPDVPVDAEPVISRCWSKNAEQRWGEDGRLRAWEPE